MAITKTTVTGPIVDATGAAYQRAYLRFTPNATGGDDTADTVIARGPVEVQPDETTGAFSIELAPSDDITYTVDLFAAETPQGGASVSVKYRVGLIQVPALGPVALQDLLPIYDPSLPTNAELLAALSAAVAEAEAAAAIAVAAATPAAELVENIRITRDAFSELASVTSSDLGVGEYARIMALGATYQRAPDAATDSDFDYSGSGGVKWNVMLSSPAVGRAWNVIPDLTDMTTEIQDAIDAVADAGGDELRLPAGRYGFSSAITIPEGVDISFGTGVQTDFGRSSAFTALVAIGAGAQLVVNGRGGVSKNVTVDGAGIAGSATEPLVRINDAVQRNFHGWKVLASAGGGMVLNTSQNNLFAGLDIEGCRGDALTLSGGAGGNLFSRAEIGSNRGYGVVNRPGAASDPYSGVTQHNQLHHCIIERGHEDDLLMDGGILSTAAVGGISPGALSLMDCIVTCGRGTVDGADALVQVHGGVLELIGRNTIQGSNTTGSFPLIRQDGGSVLLGGHTILLGDGSATVGWQYDGGFIVPNGYLEFNNLPVPRGGTASFDNVFGRMKPTIIDGPVTQDLLRMRQEGQSFSRVKVSGSGKIDWGDGASAEDVNLYRSQADQLKTDDMFIAVGGFGTGDSIGSPPAGSLVRRVPFHSSTGALLGYIGVYDS